MGTGIYLRISKDRTGEAAGVGRQRQDCRTLAEARGWGDLTEYVDNDQSASNGTRPAYQRLIHDIESGAISRLVVWSVDRLYRQIIELEALINLTEDGRLEIATVKSGDINLSTADGRTMARVLVSFAQGEAAKMAERLTRKIAENAIEGKPHGGRRRYGFKANNRDHDPDEVAVILEVADRVLAGEPLHAVAQDLEKRGIKGATGRTAMTVNTLQRIITNPRTAGLVVHQGEILEGVEAQWKPILDRETWDRVKRAINNGPKLRGRTPFLLTGLIVCGNCGANMGGGQSNGKRAYQCKRPVGGTKGCNRVYILADPVEGLIREALLAALDGPPLLAALQAQAENRTDTKAIYNRIEAIDANVSRLVDGFVEGIIPKADYRRQLKALTDERDRLESRLAAKTNGSVLAHLPNGIEAIKTKWDTAGIGWRRALVAALIESVTVNRATPGAPRRFDPERISVTWRA